MEYSVPSHNYKHELYNNTEKQKVKKQSTKWSVYLIVLYDVNKLDGNIE